MKRKQNLGLKDHRRKHPRPSYKPKPVPEFLSHTDSITASKFAACRLPEMKSLWRTFSSSTPQHNDDLAHFHSRGCTTSSRHLRRRTGSHFRRKRHRFPRSDGGESEQRSRKTKRKPAIMKDKYTQWHMIPSNHEDITSNHSQTNMQKKWLDTHLWHTKRFHMSPPMKCFDDWCIPLGHINRGSRAALRLARTKSTIQDATYAISGKSFILECSDEEELHLVVESICGGRRAVSAPFLLDKSILSGFKVGYGLVYDVKQTYPSGLIGPSTFLFGKTTNNQYFVRIVTEASIFKTVEVSLRQMASEHLHDDSWTLDVEPIALLKIRGREATNAITSSLTLVTESNENEEQNSILWQNLSKFHDIHSFFPHGCIVPADLVGINATDRNLTSVCEDVGDNNGVTRINPMEEMKGTVTDRIKEMMDEGQNMNLPRTLRENNVVIIAQVPNEDTSDVVVNGWDIVCHPQRTNEIFSALSMVGGACAIGYVEAASISMQAKTPTLLWPRDYPDCEIGKEYYSSESDEWQVFRYCTEEGTSGGRIKTGLKRLLARCSDASTDLGTKVDMKSIDWSQFYDHIDSDSVVIRGNFIAPFEQVICNFDPHFSKRMENFRETKGVQRRPRRKVQNKFGSIQVPILSQDRLEAQRESCSTLLSSLSFPALLRCYLVVEGTGTIPSGSMISFESESESGSIELGFVISSSFSRRYGYNHGIGFISAKGFLSCLMQVKSEDLRIRKDPNNNDPKVNLVVGVQVDDTRVTTVSLSILK